MFKNDPRLQVLKQNNKSQLKRQCPINLDIVEILVAISPNVTRLDILCIMILIISYSLSNRTHNTQITNSNSPISIL